MAQHERVQPTETDLAQLFSAESAETRDRAYRIGQQLGRIINVFKGQEGLNWADRSRNERVSSTSEVKVGETFSAWLEVIVDATPQRVKSTPDWLERITHIDLALNKYDAPFDGIVPPEQDASDLNVLRFIPLPGASNREQRPFQPYNATYEAGWPMETRAVETAIAVLSLMATHFEADPTLAQA